MPCSAAQPCAPALVIAFSCVQLSPERNQSTGTGPSCASSGRNRPKVMSPPQASEACEYTPCTPLNTRFSEIVFILSSSVRMR